MSLSQDLEPAGDIVLQALGRHLGDADETARAQAAEDVVQRLLHAGWLQIPSSPAVLAGEPSPDMDSGGAG
jgi:hypothetical protein